MTVNKTAVTTNKGTMTAKKTATTDAKQSKKQRKDTP